MVLSSYNMMICVSVFVSDDDDDDKSHNEWLRKVVVSQRLLKYSRKINLNKNEMCLQRA